MAESSKKLPAWLKYVAIAAIVALAIILAARLGVLEFIYRTLEALLAWVDSLGPWGPIAYILIYVAAAVLFLSGGVLTLGAGLLFGVIKGFVLTSVASISGATAAFLVGRYLARDRVAKLIEGRPSFKAIDAAVAREGWKIVGLTRLSPVFPFVFLNYAFGVTKVSLRDYVVASWIGMMPGTLLYVYLGSLTEDIASLGAGAGDEASGWRLALNIVGLAATFGVTLYVTKIARKALNEKTDLEETSPDAQTDEPAAGA